MQKADNKEMISKQVRIVIIGGGPVNIQVAMLTKTVLSSINAKMTWISESDSFYYSGMLPAAISSN